LGWSVHHEGASLGTFANGIQEPQKSIGNLLHYGSDTPQRIGKSLTI